ncbi:hypothetical protein [Actinoplanes sp. HUAS TT8]|uniref:hypothetical protein n=1 Tax=Actinoplanes sp. HUAS TT8 TaxID=3447453 RepID=UPI003F51C109
MTNFEDYEPAQAPVGELMSEVIDLADQAVAARLADGQLAMRREILKLSASPGAEAVTGPSRHAGSCVCVPAPARRAGSVAEPGGWRPGPGRVRGCGGRASC